MNTSTNTGALIGRSMLETDSNFHVTLVLDDGARYESIVSFATHDQAIAFALDIANEGESAATHPLFERVHAAANEIFIVWGEGNETHAVSAL